MKPILRRWAELLAAVNLFGAASAAITIPDISGTDVAGIDGRLDGTLAVGGTITIDLSQSKPGDWDGSPESGTKGIYDSDKWAVVFKYSSVNIPPSVTVKFKNNATRAPVVWLVTGDVTIGGDISLDGEGPSRQFPEPGPGGFRGSDTGFGFGIGGAKETGASYRTQGGQTAGPPYGGSEIVHLIGGSGSGYKGFRSAGGGAILIIATGTIRIEKNGRISARGGYYGSGGAVRLVASSIGGEGGVHVDSDSGSAGYVRIEAEVFEANSISVYPSEASSNVLTGPVRVWPEPDSATARILAVSGLPVLPDPKAALGVAPTDLNVPFAGSRVVTIETQNFPTNGTVTLFVTSASGSRAELVAQFVGGTPAQATWETTLDASLSGRVALQVRAEAQ